MQSSFLTRTIGKVFGQLSIDYCCGGKTPHEAACRAKGLDPARVASEQARVDREAPQTTGDPAAMGLGELADHIIDTHHAYLARESSDYSGAPIRCRDSR